MASTDSDTDTEILSVTDVDGDENDFDATEYTAVRHEVDTIVLRYQSEQDPGPPFTAGELIVMACLNGSTATGLDTAEITLRILNMFPYYRRKAMEHYAQMQTQSPDFGGEPEYQELTTGFQKAFCAYDVPLVCRDDANRQVYWDQGEDQICVSPRAGRIYLRRWLESKRKGAFSFLELPAELRNTIYEMVFSFPREGIVVSGAARYLTVTRRAEQPVDFEGFDLHVRGFDDKLAGSDDIEAFALKQRHQNLDFLRVSKQIHDEALPFFFGCNRFWCVKEGGSINFLRRLTPRRVEHLQDLRIDVSYDWGDPKGFPAAMKKLAMVKRLRRLQVHISNDRWFAMAETQRMRLGRRTKFTKYGQIPGFQDLAVACSKAEVVEWAGVQRGSIKRWVEGEVVKLKKVAEQAESKEAGAKKRKATDAEGVGKDSGSREQDGKKPRKKGKKTETSSEVAEDGA